MKLGSQIRELRRAAGMTQEQLGEKLMVSPQAVSKWELDTGFPDINLIPMMANLFGVSIDTIFGFDIEKREEKIEQLRREAGKYFWDDPEKCEQMLLAAIEKYPTSDSLKADLLDLYITNAKEDKKDKKEAYLTKAAKLAGQLICEASDVFSLCRAKETLAEIYLRQDRYDDAKKLINSLPYMYPYMLRDKMRVTSDCLCGEDRLAEAKEWKVMETQELFIACAREGEGYYEIGDYESAIRSYTEAIDVIERFMKTKEVSYDAYPIRGTQSNHWSHYLCIAACHYKLGRSEECGRAIDRAHYIITHAWIGDAVWESDPDYYLDVYREEYHELRLDEYRPLEI